VSAAACAWFSITGSDGVAYNATPAVAGASLVLTAPGAPAGTRPVATAFGMNAWPINVVMSAEGLPLQPWSEAI
jgi:hypothetical protein